MSNFPNAGSTDGEYTISGNKIYQWDSEDNTWYKVENAIEWLADNADVFIANPNISIDNISTSGMFGDSKNDDLVIDYTISNIDIINNFFEIWGTTSVDISFDIVITQDLNTNEYTTSASTTFISGDSAKTFTETSVIISVPDLSTWSTVNVTLNLNNYMFSDIDNHLTIESSSSNYSDSQSYTH